ncbi:MAG: hypothetical protein IPK85_04525 [Gemmatimonadetes bacterium]|nr:hypothetical protein [Gemmatimonadota bacterium]
MTLPEVQLIDSRGKSVLLSDVLGGQPALLLVAGSENCWACSDVAMQLRIIRERIGIKTIPIASGTDTAIMREHFAESRLESVGLYDPERRVLKSMSLGQEPWALLVDGRGRVLFLDGGVARASVGYSLSEVITSLRDVLIGEGRYMPGVNPDAS